MDRSMLKTAIHRWSLSLEKKKQIQQNKPKARKKKARKLADGKKKLTHMQSKQKKIMPRMVVYKEL